MRQQHLDLQPGKQLILNGLLFVVEGFDGVADVHLRRIDTEQRVIYTRNALGMMLLEGKLSDTAVGNQPRERSLPPLNLDVLTDEQRAIVERRLAYVLAANRARPISPNTQKLQRIIDETAERLEDTEQPPSKHTVYKWLLAYIHNDYDVAALALDFTATRRRASRLPEGVTELIEEYLPELLGEWETESLWGVFDDLMETVARELHYDGYVSKYRSTEILNGPF